MRPFKFEWLEAVTREPRLTLSERTVATALGLYANADGTHAHPGVDRLARHLSCSERTVRRALVSIEKLGFIVLRSHGSRAGVRGRASVYDLTIPHGRKYDDPNHRTHMSAGPVENPAQRGEAEPNHRTSVTEPPDICDRTTGHRRPPTRALPGPHHQGFLAVSEADHARPLPTIWQPNRGHRTLYNRLQIGHTGRTFEQMAGEFTRNARANHVHRRDWDATFTGFLHSYAAGRAEVEFHEFVDDPADPITEGKRLIAQFEEQQAGDDVDEPEIVDAEIEPADDEAFQIVGQSQPVDTGSPW